MLASGDCVYRLYKGIKDYKNKPVPVRLRPWLYGMTDDYSGCHCFRYTAALGECSADNVDFLDWAWRNREDKEFFGISELIKGDFGPMMSEEAAKAWFALCGVKIDPSKPLNKDSHGKIERPWRTLWQSFELPFFMESDWQKFEITQSELNRRALIYQAEYNARPHRWERKYSRLQVWERINLRGGAVALPENAMAAFAKRIERTVTQEGIVKLDNVYYEVNGLHSAPVWVFQGIFDDKMSVVDRNTGLKYEIKGVYKPNTLGEFTAQPETEVQKVRKEAAQLKGFKNMLHTDESAALEAEKAPKNILKIPTRVKETRQIDSPLNVDCYASIEDAIAAFMGLTNIILDDEDYEAVAARIAENGLSKRSVAGFAAEVQMAQVSVAL
jgi:hypothetical protein